MAAVTLPQVPSLPSSKKQPEPALKAKVLAVEVTAHQLPYMPALGIMSHIFLDSPVEGFTHWQGETVIRIDDVPRLTDPDYVKATFEQTVGGFARAFKGRVADEWYGQLAIAMAAEIERYKRFHAKDF